MPASKKRPAAPPFACYLLSIEGYLHAAENVNTNSRKREFLVAFGQGTTRVCVVAANSITGPATRVAETVRRCAAHGVWLDAEAAGGDYGGDFGVRRRVVRALEPE